MQSGTKQTALNILRFHHVGLLVEHIESTMKQYAELFGEENISNIIYISSQKVKVSFVKISGESFIELVQPEDEQSVVYKLLKKRVSYYHAAYRVRDIVSAVETLEQLNYKPLEFFSSEAFENKRCIFLFTPDAYLIELIED